MKGGLLVHREVCREGEEGIFSHAGISIDSDGCGDTKYTPFLAYWCGRGEVKGHGSSYKAPHSRVNLKINDIYGLFVKISILILFYKTLTVCFQQRFRAGADGYDPPLLHPVQNHSKKHYFYP